MDLKELFKENEDELFEAYLSVPTISHALDRRRFVKYALVANHNRSGFSLERINKLKEKGVGKAQIERMQDIYEWMGEVVEALR